MTRISSEDSPRTTGARTDTTATVASVLWRRKFLVLLVALGCAVAGHAYAQTGPERFTSSARLFMSTSVPFDGIGERSFVNDPNRYVVNQAAVILSEPVLASAVKAGAASSTGVLRANLEVVPGRDADVITIKAEGATPSQAAARANAVAKAYRSHASAAVKALTANLVKLSATTLDRAEVRKRAVVFGDGVALLEVAQPPALPSSPIPMRDAVLALLVGLGVGSALALILPAGLWRRTGPRPLLAGLRAVPTRLAAVAGGATRQAKPEDGQVLQPGPAR